MATELTRADNLVFHFRIREPETDEALPRGGATVVFVPKVGLRTARFGVSVCSGKDVYSKKRGRIIATGRALSKGSFFRFADRIGDASKICCNSSSCSCQSLTIEIIRGLAKELAQEEATTILGSQATLPWMK